MEVKYKKSVHLKFSPLCNILPVNICETPHSRLLCVSMDGRNMNFSRTSPSRLTEVLGTCDYGRLYRAYLMRCATAAFLVSSFKTGLFNFNVKQKNRKKLEIFMCDNNFVILFTPGCFQSIQNHFHHLLLDMVSAKSK